MMTTAFLWAWNRPLGPAREKPLIVPAADTDRGHANKRLAHTSARTRTRGDSDGRPKKDTVHFPRPAARGRLHPAAGIGKESS